jgi:Uma2 family endonuclease
MSSLLPRRHHYSFREYLDLEEASNVRHEYADGQIYAMAGGTPEHAALAVSVSAALHGQLAGGPCRVFSSDLRVRVPASGVATYPDVTVVCGPLDRDPESPTSVTNPVVLVEILSDATEEYDRGEKFDQYKQLASLLEYVLVSQREPLIEVHRREPGGGWSSHVGRSGSIHLLSIGCALDVDAIYRSLPAG